MNIKLNFFKAKKKKNIDIQPSAPPYQHTPLAKYDDLQQINEYK